MTKMLSSRVVTYVHKYGSSNISIDIDIPIPEYTDIDEYIAMFKRNECSDFLNEDELRDSLTKFINEEQEKMEDEFGDTIIKNVLTGNQVDISSKADCYKIGNSILMECEPEAELFADRFSYVMRTSPSTELTALMMRKVEINREMYDLIQSRNWEVNQLTRECEAILNKPDNTNIHPHQLSKLNEKLRIEALCEKHRKDYRDLVNILYEGGTIINTRKRNEVEVEETSQIWRSDPRSSTSPEIKYESDSDALVDESFTIYIGAQLKSMHNVRLVTAKSLVGICTPSHDVDSGSVLQMSMSLYGRSLSGLILLVPREALWHTSSRSPFAQLCEQSTELHFESLGCQLKKVANSTREANCWRVDCLSNSENSEKRELQGVMRNDETLSIGDVYITRHSNLRDVQIVFHLVIDEQLLTSDISSRHPCLNGIRNIIRLTSRLGITSIHIPLLLIEQASESTTVAWCIRRAEMVYKCVKGYLMEVCAMCGGSVTGCPSLLVPHYNVYFVLPSGLAPTVYQQISAMFPTIFQVVPSVSSGN